MASAEWRELATAVVLGRPTQVWRRRPHHVLDLLDLSVGDPAQDFIVQGHRRISYASFRKGVDAAAATLIRHGVVAGDRVLVVLYNSPEFWLVQWAAWRIGAVPVLGNRWWSKRDLRDALERVAPAVLATDLAYVDDGRPLLHVTLRDIAAWWDMPAPATAPTDPRSSADEDEVAVIVFTAGSTGAPKGVQLTHRNLVWTQQTIHAMRGGKPLAAANASDRKVALMTTPLFHNGGMVAAIGTMIDGGKIVMLNGKFDPEQAMKLIETERVTTWSAVPTMFRRILHHDALPNYDLSSLVAPASGGTIVSRQFLQELRHGLPGACEGFSSGYGMTEMSFLTMVSGGQLDARPGTVGTPILGAEVRIADPDHAGEGEIVGRSGALMAGYLGEVEQPIDDDGWYHTGDLGRIDAEGYLYVIGRLKDMVIRGGENISCAHVETAILAHNEVLEAAVIGYPDEEFGEALAAIVHLCSGSRLSQDDLAEFVKSRLAYFERPSRWQIWDHPLPSLPTGKVDKRSLSKVFCAPLPAV